MAIARSIAAPPVLVAFHSRLSLSVPSALRRTSVGAAGAVNGGGTLCTWASAVPVTVALPEP